MSPLRPDQDPAWAGVLSPIDPVHSRTYIVVHDEWPRVRVEIDANRLAMIGLVRTASADPRQLNRNHQVMVYGYELEESSRSLLVCDPNHPGAAIVLALDVSKPGGSTSVSYSGDDGPVDCFFLYPYSSKDPAPWR